jgi:hypothetical protein
MNVRFFFSMIGSAFYLIQTISWSPPNLKSDTLCILPLPENSPKKFGQGKFHTDALSACSRSSIIVVIIIIITFVVFVLVVPAIDGQCIVECGIVSVRIGTFAHVQNFSGLGMMQLRDASIDVVLKGNDIGSQIERLAKQIGNFLPSLL